MARRSKNMNKKNIMIVAVGGIIVFGLVFYCGMKFGVQNPTSSNKGSFNGQFNPQGMQGAGNQGGKTLNRAGGMGSGASGEVIAKDDKTITVKLKDGGSKIVFYSEKTPVLKMATTSLSDVLVGDQVMVIGSSNQDGSVNAESIQLR